MEEDIRKKQTACIIGRFQAPYLHLGHIYLIASALQRYGRAVVLLGTTDQRDERNPYSVAHRKEIIQRIFPQVETNVLWDQPNNDELWSSMVDEIAADYPSPILFHSRDSFKDHYKGKLSLHEIPELQGYSGTKVRKEVGSGTTLS